MINPSIDNINNIIYKYNVLANQYGKQTEYIDHIVKNKQFQIDTINDALKTYQTENETLKEQIIHTTDALNIAQSENETLKEQIIHTTDALNIAQSENETLKEKLILRTHVQPKKDNLKETNLQTNNYMLTSNAFKRKNINNIFKIKLYN